MTDDVEDAAPDHRERLRDFFARHGGPSTAAKRHGESQGGVEGWSEVMAADGYTLRCDWSRFGTREKLQYSEIPP